MGRSSAPSPVRFASDSKRPCSRGVLSLRVPPQHVYVHVPFCARRCVYCDFAIAVRRHVPVDEYVSAIGRELSVRFSENEPWPAETLYLGGGTPSRLGGEGVARLTAMIERFLTGLFGASNERLMRRLGFLR